MAPTRRRTALVVCGAAALLATACASSLGYKTPCSVWVSMNFADQQSTMINIAGQQGDPNPSAGILNAVRLANAYCADPLTGDDTIGGMLDDRPQ